MESPKPESTREAALRECPFCGNTNPTLDNLTEPDDFHVECGKCHLGQHAIHTREEAIAAWNSRVSAPAVEAGEGKPVAWMIWFCGEPTENVWTKEEAALSKLGWLNANYPNRTRKLVPLYDHPSPSAIRLAQEGGKYDAQYKFALTLVNSIPELQSLLYDMNLLPEQIQRGSKQCDQMILIAHHFGHIDERLRVLPIQPD